MQQEPETPKETKTSQKIVRVLFFVAGSVSLVLGAIGIVLPILPTTPFLLLALACYFRSSERMTHWMLNNKYFGKYIRNYKEGKGIPLKTKLFAITILLFAVAAAVTLHLFRLPTYRHKHKPTL